MATEYRFQSSAELKAWRATAGWSQMDLARMAGVHVQTVKYHEGMNGLIGGWAVNRFRAAFELHRVLPPKTSCLERFLQADNGEVPQSAASEHSNCGAKTRSGTPCRAKALPGRNRCRFHGGMSTGPKTIEGRQRIAEAQHRRWERWGAQQEQANSA